MYSARWKREDAFPVPPYKPLSDWIPLQKGICVVISSACASTHGWERLKTETLGTG